MTIVTRSAEGDKKSFAQMAAFFKVVADPSRLAIVNILSCAGDEKLTSLDIEARLTVRGVPFAQSTISFHLGHLLDAGLVTRDKRNPFSYWALNPEKWEGDELAWLRELLAPPKKRRITVRM